VPLTNDLLLDQADKNHDSQYFEDHVLQHLTMKEMIHKRFVFETCGIALPWFATIQELLNAVLMLWPI